MPNLIRTASVVSYAGAMKFAMCAQSTLHEKAVVRMDDVRNAAMNIVTTFPLDE